MLSRDQILKLASVKSVISKEKCFWTNCFLTQRSKFLPWEFLKFWKKASRSILWISAIMKIAKIWHFCKFFNFYPILNNYKIRTGKNFENPNGKTLDLHLIMWFVLKELLPGSAYFTVAIFKVPQISKHFSAMQTQDSSILVGESVYCHSIFFDVQKKILQSQLYSYLHCTSYTNKQINW